MKWYIKVPYISTGLGPEDIKALCVALPSLMEAFREAVRRDVAKPDSELVRRLPKALIEGFATTKGRIRWLPSHSPGVRPSAGLASYCNH